MRSTHTISNPVLEQQLQDLCNEWLTQFDDPIATAQAVGWLLDVIQTELGPMVSAHRIRAVRQLRHEGFSLAEIAAQLGLTRARIDAIAKA